jgi:signal transduction histidine kinase
LVNFVSNALKFTPPEGKVEVILEVIKNNKTGKLKKKSIPIDD